MFVTAVNPMFVHQHKAIGNDLTNPRDCRTQKFLEKSSKCGNTVQEWIAIRHDPTAICIKKSASKRSSTKALMKLNFYINVRMFSISKREHLSTFEKSEECGQTDDNEFEEIRSGDIDFRLICQFETRKSMAGHNLFN